MEPVAYQQVVATPVSLRDSPCRITVWDAGVLEDDIEQPGLRLPANHRATCQQLLGSGPAASMETAFCPEAGGMTCTVTLENSVQQVAGSNPTAAVVAAALAQGNNQYVNGVKAFGLANPAVQQKLQQDFVKVSGGSSVSTATEADHEVVGAAAGSSTPTKTHDQQALSPLAAKGTTPVAQHLQAHDSPSAAGDAAAAAGASAAPHASLTAAADAAPAAPKPPSPSVLVQTSALPPLQLRQHAVSRPSQQDSLQQRVVQTGATVASPRDSPMGSAIAAAAAAAAGSRSPLPPIATGQTPTQRRQVAGPPTPAAMRAPTPPPRVRTPLSAKAPLGLFKPSPSRGGAVAPLPAAQAADGLGGMTTTVTGGPGSSARLAPELMQFAAQQLHSGAAAPAGAPSGLPAFKPGQPGGGGAFSRFNAASRVPPSSPTAHLQPSSPLSPFIAARSAVTPASLAATAAASASLFGYPLTGAAQLNAPSWSGSNISCSSMLGASAFDGTSTHAGSLDASSLDLRGLSRGSLSAGSVESLASWAPLQRLSAGSTDALRDYLGQFAGGSWDPSNYSPAALVAFAQSARLSSSARGGASLRAVAAAAVAAASPDNGTREGAAAAGGAVADAAAGPLAKKQRRTAPAAPPAASQEPAAGSDGAGDAPQRQPSPQGRLTPEALSQGAAAAEAALSSQGLLNPSAATVKAPRVAAKGWTAFTAFGLHTRDAVRGANPGATSVEVEKLVGQLWGRLSKGEKQGWVARAARARSARGPSSNPSGQARQKRKRPAAGAADSAAPAAGAGAGSPLVHRQKRSSRIRRPPARTLSSGELLLGVGAPQGGPAPVIDTTMPSANFVNGGTWDGGDSMGGGGLARSIGTASTLQASPSEAAAELELEVGTVEVLASMQAAAADSHRGMPA